MAKKKPRKADPKPQAVEGEASIPVFCPPGAQAPTGPMPPSQFLESLKTANEQAMAHMEQQRQHAVGESQLQVAMQVLTLGAHCEKLYAEFEAEGMIHQAVGIVKVRLMTGPLAEKVRRLPDGDEQPC